jgi:hypothetical protein
MPPAIAGTRAFARKLCTGMNGPVMGACAPNIIWLFPYQSKLIRTFFLRVSGGES